MSDQLEDSGSIAVKIHGRTYYLRGDGDGTYLKELADVVDSKMREVSEVTGTADTLKVAILASLNLADDYLKASGGTIPDNRESERRLAKLVTTLDEVLAS